MLAILYNTLIVAILLVLLGFVLVNLAVLPRMALYSSAPQSAIRNPQSAILVPARNEEPNIGACLRSLLAQDYSDFEVWLYDDSSADRTLEIAREISAGNPRLHIVEGSAEPPPGWLGKAHACHLLYEAMRARTSPAYVLFTDADVQFAPSALSHAIATAEARGAGLVSAFPRQLTVSWAERLAVPILLHWAVYSFLPLPAAFTLRMPAAFAAANGQFMLFKREAYEACGGHTAVRSSILEDVGLARAVKRAGFPALLADAGSLVRTRMYNGPQEVWRGYSKNAFAFFGYSPFFLALGILVLMALYVVPPLLAILSLVALPFSPSIQSSVLLFALVQYMLAVLARLALAQRFGYRLLDTFFHPVAILYLIAICINSMHWKLSGKGAWKGRVPSAPY